MKTLRDQSGWLLRLSSIVPFLLIAACSGHAGSDLTTTFDAAIFPPFPVNRDSGTILPHFDASHVGSRDGAADHSAHPVKDARAEVGTNGDTGIGPGVDATSFDSGPCPSGQLVCGGSCIFPETDDANCGKCGNICGAGLACNQGTCGCPTGFVFCNGTCTNTSTDSENCGMCGVACAAGLACTAGACSCAPPTTLCGTACVDESSDPNNCGACNTACGAGLACSNGACTCAIGLTYCTPPRGSMGACTDTLSDPSNCGACNNVCATGEGCINGQCACPGGETSCTGIGCVDLATDPSHCGLTCPGVTCPTAESCENGTCACATAGATYCAASDVCTNLETDPANCGACGRSCGAEACSAGSCVNPLACAFPLNTCTAPYTCLASDLCGCASTTPTYCAATNTCVNTTSDPQNCGSCGHSCGTEACTNSVCTVASTCALVNNDACTPGLASPCCAPAGGAICGSTEITFGTATTDATYENLCCITQGQPCNDLTLGTCCGFMACNGTTCACQPVGHHCVNTADCCGATCTSAHICGQTCVATTVGCELGDKCCTTNAACPASGVCP